MFIAFSWLRPCGWPQAGRCCRGCVLCLLCGARGAFPSAFMIPKPQHLPSSQNGRHPRPGFSPHPEPCEQRSHPKCLDPKQLCQECSSVLPAKNGNSSSSAMIGNSDWGVCSFYCNSWFSCWFCLSSAPRRSQVCSSCLRSSNRDVMAGYSR